MEHYELFSARFAFCPLRQEDAQDVYALTGDAQVARYMAFSAHTDLDQARALIEQYNAGAGQGFALRERESGDFIGVFALKEAKIPGRRDISIFLAPSWWGKGCAGEVFAWAIGYAARAGIAQLAAHVAAGNTASRRALERNGFILHEVLPIEGLAGGLCVYLRILAADYAWIPDYLKAKKGVTWDFKVEWQWERYKIGEKLFAALCKNKAGEPIVSLKCEPEASLLLQGEYPGIQPGYYCDKKHWISIRLDGSVPDTVIKQRLDTAYTLVLHKLPKKRQEQILG